MTNAKTLSAPAQPAFDHPFLNALRERVLIGDGAMGTQLQAVELDLDKDFLGLE